MFFLYKKIYFNQDVAKDKAASFFFSELWHDKKTFGKAELKKYAIETL